MIVRRNTVSLAAIDLDVIALHAVVAESQVRDAAALPLARFQVEQVLIAVLADPLQLVELGVVTRSNDTALAQDRRWLLDDCTHQQCVNVRIRAGTRGEIR